MGLMLAYLLSTPKLLYLRMVLPSSRAPPPHFSASSTNRRTAHLAGRRRQPLTPQTWASLAEPLAPRHVRLPLTPPPRVFPFSADEDTRSLTPNIIPHTAPHNDYLYIFLRSRYGRTWYVPASSSTLSMWIPSGLRTPK